MSDYLQNRIRNTISAARVGLVKRVDQPDPNLPEFFVWFASRITPFQIEMVNHTALTVTESASHGMAVRVPDEWMPKRATEFEPLALNPRPVNQHLVAFACVCSVCQQQYDAVCTRRFADEQRLADLEGIYKKRCPVCDKIESRATLQPKLSNNMPLNALPPIIPVPQPPILLLPPMPQPAMSPEITELVEAARAALEWYRSLELSFVGGTYRRLADALIPFEQVPVALVVVK